MEHLRQLIVDCMDGLTAFQSISTSTNNKYACRLFQSLLANISLCMEALRQRATQLTNQTQRNMIMLCICQISKCLPLLLSVVETITNKNLCESQESLRYVTERLRWCLDELLKGIAASQSSDVDQQSEPPGSKFVHTMDIALELVNSLTSDVDQEGLDDAIKELKSVIEELLCHAMTIVQIAGPSDFDDITLSSQKILSALEQFKTECLSVDKDPAVCRLFASTLRDGLETVEQQVNTAVLRLVLQVFCEPCTPLKLLVECCSSEKAVSERQASDLDLLIVDFDLLMDRIMQIGMFAMACTGDYTRILNTRSCLASLESLEPELVPTLTALYLEPCNKNHRNHLKILTSHWILEVHKLHNLIDGIVDPAAFCQITIEEISELLSSAKQSIRDKDSSDLQVSVRQLVEQSKQLVRHLEISMKEVELVSGAADKQLLSAIRHLNLACHECDVCARLVFKEVNSEASQPEGQQTEGQQTEGQQMEGQQTEGQQTYKQTEQLATRTVQWNRVLKRCQLVLSTMKKVQPLLFQLMDTTQPDDKPKPVHKSCLNSADQSQTSVSSKDDRLSSPLKPLKKGGGVYGKQSDLRCLLPYLDAGMMLRQERSIMYNTPVKHRPVGSHVLASASKPQYRLFSRCLSYRDTTNNQTLGLDITGILDKVSSLCDTLNSLAGESLLHDISVPPLAVDKVSPPLLSVTDNPTGADQTLQSVTDETVHSGAISHLATNETTFGEIPLKMMCSFDDNVLVGNDNAAAASSRSLGSSYQVDTYDRLNDLDNLEQRLKLLQMNALNTSGLGLLDL